MDGTLLDKRVIYSAGKKFGFISKINEITRNSEIAYIRSQKIAKLLRGISIDQFSEVVKSIPFTNGTTETVKRLKDDGYIVGIISDSYTSATEIVSNKLNMNFQIANQLEEKNGVFTGNLKMPQGWEKIGCSCMQSVCKHYQLKRIAIKYGVNLSNTIAIGDSSSDRCMIEHAGIGIWFNYFKDSSVENVINEKNLNLIFNYIKY